MLCGIAENFYSLFVFYVIYYRLYICILYKVGSEHFVRALILQNKALKSDSLLVTVSASYSAN